MKLLDKIESIVADALMDGFSHELMQSPSVKFAKLPNSDNQLSLNTAMVVFKQIDAVSSPREVAECIAGKLTADPDILDAHVVDPGFVNVVVNPKLWQSHVNDVISSGDKYGSSSIGDGKNVSVEFVSANPTGALHIGHARGAVFGDALANILEFTGHEVTREYYVNDAGNQIDALVESVKIACGKINGVANSNSPEYSGECIDGIAENLIQLHGSDADDGTIGEFAVNHVMKLIVSDLQSANIHMDHFASEKALRGKLDDSISQLHECGHVFNEVMKQPPKGQHDPNWKPHELPMFKFNESDAGRPLKKSNGDWTYFAPDIAYHHDKMNRGHDVLFNVFGADHSGYANDIKNAVSVLSNGDVQLHVIMSQMVNLIKDGKLCKMSKRSGNVVPMKEIIDLVGADVLRFVMLSRKNDTQLEFDTQKVTRQSSDNPVFYVQYAHARICSVMRNAVDAGIDVSDSALIDSSKDLLDNDAEHALVCKVAEFEKCIETSALNHEPHRIVYYLHELASQFHSFWNKGSKNKSLRFIHADDHEMSQSKIALARIVQLTIANGLSVMGINPVDRM